MIFLIIFFLFVFVLWAVVKKPLWKWITTILVLVTPAVLLAIHSGYIYASSITLLMLTTVLVYNFKEKNKISKTKTLLALPFIFLIIYITNKANTGTENTSNTSDLVLSIIIICLSLFITGLASILILSRTRGEKVND